MRIKPLKTTNRTKEQITEALEKSIGQHRFIYPDENMYVYSQMKQLFNSFRKEPSDGEPIWVS